MNFKKEPEQCSGKKQSVSKNKFNSKLPGVFRAFAAGVVLISVSTAAVSAATLPEWNYNDAEGTGPSYWGQLATTDGDLPYKTCGTGREQSPIDLSDATFGREGMLETRYESWSLNVENNGHTIQVNLAPGSTMTIGNQTYYLLQFHFHAGSEHTVNGQHEPVEMHFVHMNSRGELAVLGVFVEEDPSGNPNPQIAKILNLAPQEIGKTAVQLNAVDTDDLLPSRNIHDYWTYNGSLTTPPCTEGVQWYVSKIPVHASHDQIVALENLLQHQGIPNFRPTQPLNDRILYENQR